MQRAAASSETHKFAKKILSKGVTPASGAKLSLLSHSPIRLMRVIGSQVKYLTCAAQKPEKQLPAVIAPFRLPSLALFYMKNDVIAREYQHWRRQGACLRAVLKSRDAGVVLLLRERAQERKSLHPKSNKDKERVHCCSSSVLPAKIMKKYEINRDKAAAV
jgi:hypothetical protein